jgi:hypothetical protein
MSGERGKDVRFSESYIGWQATGGQDLSHSGARKANK